MNIEGVIQRLEADPENLKAHWSLPPAEARFLSILAAAQQAKRVLEVGTSLGYSTLWLALAAVEHGGEIETLEASKIRWEQAIQHFQEAGLQSVITATQGDAVEVLQTRVLQAAGQYDLVFLDANKSQYFKFFQLSEQLLRPGGLLVADNTQSHRTQMTDFIDAVMVSPHWRVSDLQTPNGLIIARKSFSPQD